MNEDMREDTEAQVKDVETVINLNSLEVEGAETVSNLITTLEAKLFTKNGDKFIPALELHVDKAKGISEERVAADKRLIDIYKLYINKAIEKITDWLNQVETANAFNNTKLSEKFSVQNQPLAEVAPKLSKLIGLLQTYLDIFQDWESGVSVEAFTFSEATKKIQAIEERMNGILIGQKDVVHFVLAALLTRGHVLIEGNPGLGKTELAKSVGEILRLNNKRIQFTPSTSPEDIIGYSPSSGANPKGGDDFHYGPIFADVVLADEINRANPKTQAALLQAMGEGAVTNGRTRKLSSVHLVIATQNPKDDAGTYPLPIAQLDRFALKVNIELPDLADSNLVLDHDLSKTQNSEKPDPLANRKDVIAIQKAVDRVSMPDRVRDYISRLIQNTDPDKSSAMASVKEFVLIGASPRSAKVIAMGAKFEALSQGRNNASVEDVRKFIHAALDHRITLNQTAGSNPNISVESIIDDVIKNTPP